MNNNRHPNRYNTLLTLSTLLACIVFAVPLSAIVIDRTDYEDRLRAYWLGVSLANWTGLRTENVRPGWNANALLPLYTSADWGTYDALADREDHRNGWIDWVFPEDVPGGDPNTWGSDDDTDIEYMYLHLLYEHGTTTLTGEQIRDGWLKHIDTNPNGTPLFLWASNANAWTLMRDFGQMPPHTGMLQRSSYRSFEPNPLMLSGLLTTEFFGLMGPAMPEKALKMANLPMTVTTDGYAYQAAQFNALMLSFASVVDPELSMKEKIVWLLNETRQMIPNTSRIAEMYDYIRADYLANPNKENWESTRNKIYQRYQVNATQYGFRYFGQNGSAINHAAGIMALFYGEGDYQKTVRIGVLAGWDSDNPTASNGGLIAFLLGTEGLQAQFPERNFPDQYNIFRTRVGFPDYLPDDSAANDTFTLMAARMLTIIDMAVEEGGGILDEENNSWIIPDLPPANLQMNPRWQLRLRSANLRVREAGGTVTAVSTAGGSNVAALADGYEHRFHGEEVDFPALPRYAGGNVSNATVSVTYDRPVDVHSIRLIQGGLNGAVAGRFSTLQWQARINNEWTILQGTAPAIVPGWRFQQIDFYPDRPVMADGIRVTGNVGGGNLSLFELDAFAAPFGKGYGNWTETFFAASMNEPHREATVWGSQADPDGDGFSNLFEYYMGLNPHEADPAAVYQISADAGNGNFVFRCRANPEVDDLHVKVQQWTESGGWQTTHENPVTENGYITITYPAETSGLLVRLVLEQ